MLTDDLRTEAVCNPVRAGHVLPWEERAPAR